MADLQKLVVRLEAETARFQRDLDKSRGKLATFEKGASSSLRKVAGHFAAFASVGVLGRMAKQLIDVGDNFAKMSQKTGVSVETLSRFGYAADLSGTSIDGLGTSLNKFARSTADAEMGLKTAQDAFAAVGVSVEELAGLSNDERLLRMADAFSEYEDGAEKAAVALTLFGRAGVEQIPLLNMGSVGLRQLAKESDDLANTWDTETAKAAEQFNDDLHRLTVLLTGQFREALSGVIAPLNNLNGLLIDAGKHAKDAKPHFTDLGEILKGLATTGILAGLGIELVGRSIATIGTTVWEAIAGDDPVGPGKVLLTGLNDIVQAAQDARDKLDAIWQPDLPVEDSLTDKADGIATDRPKKKIVFGNSTGADAAASRIQGTIAALQQEAATLGMTASQVKLYELALDGASVAELEAARAALQSVEAYDLKNEATEDAIAWGQEVDAMYRQNEAAILGLDYATLNYNDTLEQLNVLLREGVISQEQFDRAAAKSAEQLDTYANAVHGFTLNLREDIKQSTAGLFQNLISDGANWKDHLLDYLGQIGDAFARMAADMAAQAIFGTTGGSGGGGINWLQIGLGALQAGIGGYAGGGGAGAGAGLINTGGGFNPRGLTVEAGARLANGGIMPAGQWSMVGEEGPELVMSRTSRMVLNNDDTMDALGGRGGISQVFNIQTPDANSFVASQRQIQRKGRAALGVA